MTPSATRLTDRSRTFLPVKQIKEGWTAQHPLSATAWTVERSVWTWLRTRERSYDHVTGSIEHTRGLFESWIARRASPPSLWRRCWAFLADQRCHHGRRYSTPCADCETWNLASIAFLDRLSVESQWFVATGKAAVDEFAAYLESGADSIIATYHFRSRHADIITGLQFLIDYEGDPQISNAARVALVFALSIQSVQVADRPFVDRYNALMLEGQEAMRHHRQLPPYLYSQFQDPELKDRTAPYLASKPR